MRGCLRAAIAIGLVCLAAPPVRAQTPSPPPSAPRLLPRAGFSFGWASLLTTDRRFDWQGQVSVDFDVVDYGAGRLSFRGDYEAMIGRERRRYDLNQGTYFFEAAASWRRGPVETAAVIQHASRHVVDREHEPAVSWNAAAARLRYSWRGGGTAPRRLDSEIELGRVTQPAFVDYRWVSRARVTATEPLTERLAVVARATGEAIGVERAIANRPRVCGGRIEAALRVSGTAASFEIFAGYERRIDAFPTDRFRVRWFTAGFRVISR